MLRNSEGIYKFDHVAPGVCLGMFWCISSLRESEYALLLLIAPLALANRQVMGELNADSAIVALSASFFSLVALSALITSGWSEAYPVFAVAVIAALVFFHCLYFGESIHIAWAMMLSMFLAVSFWVLILGIAQNNGPQEIVNRIDLPLMIVPNDYAAFLILLPFFMDAAKRFPLPGANAAAANRAAPAAVGAIAVLTSMVLDSRLCLLLCLICFALEFRASFVAAAENGAALRRASPSERRRGRCFAACRGR